MRLLGLVNVGSQILRNFRISSPTLGGVRACTTSKNRDRQCGVGVLPHDPHPKKKRKRVDSDARPVPQTVNPNMKANALKIFDAGIQAVLPNQMVKQTLQVEGNTLTVKGGKTYNLENNVYILAFGKAVGGMVRSAQELLGDHIVKGIVSLPDGITQTARDTGRDYLVPMEDCRMSIYEGALNNIPDENSVTAANAIHTLAQKVGKCDLALTFISGGGSSLLSLPVPPITLCELQEVVGTMNKAGADIHQMNAIRKHIELLKGGGLARAIAPAQILALTLSNVVGNNVNDVAGSPLCAATIPPERCLEYLSGIYDECKQCMPDSVRTVLSDSTIKTPKIITGRKDLEPQVNNVLLGNNLSLTCAAAEIADQLGAIPYVFASDVEGETREVGTSFAKLAQYVCQVMGHRKGTRDGQLMQNEINLIQQGIKKTTLKELELLAQKSMNTSQAICIIAGSNTTNRPNPQTESGRAQLMALQTAIDLHEIIFQNDYISANFDVCFLSCATSGLDGNGQAAGAVVDPATSTRAQLQNLDPVDFLERNDASSFFKQLSCGEDQIVTGFTGTEVMDFHLLLIKPNLF
jgi:glycerate kinase